jgi:REP-associated tyrosine transposase
MDDYESLSHSKWECKYHVVFIPKYRRKTLYAELRRHLGEVFRKLADHICHHYAAAVRGAGDVHRKSAQ